MPETSILNTPLRVGALELPNRIIMAPLTRCRAGEGRVPTELMAEYHAQRASAGKEAQVFRSGNESMASSCCFDFPDC